MQGFHNQKIMTERFFSSPKKIKNVKYMNKRCVSNTKNINAKEQNNKNNNLIQRKINSINNNVLRKKTNHCYRLENRKNTY